MDGGCGPRVVIVGGGSYQWGPKLILDVATDERLRGGRLVLHDTDPGALDDVFRWGGRALGLAGSHLELTETGRLDEALRGADFVVLSISTGGLDAMAHDLEIPEGYGVVQTVGDTVGPGGRSGRYATSPSSWVSRARWSGCVQTPSCST